MHAISDELMDVGATQKGNKSTFTLGVRGMRRNVLSTVRRGCVTIIGVPPPIYSRVRDALKVIREVEVGFLFLQYGRSVRTLPTTSALLLLSVAGPWPLKHQQISCFPSLQFDKRAAGPPFLAIASADRGAALK